MHGADISDPLILFIVLFPQVGDASHEGSSCEVRTLTFCLCVLESVIYFLFRCINSPFADDETCLKFTSAHTLNISSYLLVRKVADYLIFQTFTFPASQI